MRRTRQLLQGALGALMKAKSFDEISVQDIAEAATVNRATFYDHYTDKFQLLNAMVAGGFHQMLHERHVQFDGTCAFAAGAIILATRDYLTQVHSGGGCERQSAFEPLLDAAITLTIRRVLLAGLERHRSASGVDPEVTASAASWAICGAVKQWVAEPKGLSSEQMVPVILAMVLPMLSRAISEGAEAERKAS